jgi:hypothetical protein
MRRILIISILFLISATGVFSQTGTRTDNRILISGIIRDAGTLDPIPNSQIRINRYFAAVSDENGTFAIRVNRRDTLIFSLLGYQVTYFYVSDTLSGSEFMTGVYMITDTLSVGEVIIIPRIKDLRYNILRTPAEKSIEMENARYNMEISAYHGRIALSQLGDPVSNYSVIQQKQHIDSYDKGMIPSDRIVSMNPLILIPIAYLIIAGPPDGSQRMKSYLTRQELDQIHKKYLETTSKYKYLLFTPVFGFVTT